MCRVGNKETVKWCADWSGGEETRSRKRKARKRERKRDKPREYFWPSADQKENVFC